MLDKIADSLFGSEEDTVSITSGTGRGADPENQGAKEVRRRLEEFKKN